MAVLQSNTLLLVNVSDGDSLTNQQVFIKYSIYPDGGNIDGSDLQDSPSGLSGTIYMGIYVGANNSNNPKDYTWVKYEGESSYIDIRYSDDGGKTFTEPLGTTTGKWIGIFITNDSKVLEENYEPNVQDYSWSLFQADTSAFFSYTLETNFDNCTKYYNEDLKTFTFSPSILEINSYINSGDNKTITTNLIECLFYYEIINENGKSELVKYEDNDKLYENVGTLTVDLTHAPFPNLNLSQIVINLYNSNDKIIEDSETGEITLAEIILTSTKIINYGASDSLAKLAINANNIVASMKDTKVVFGEDGLTINNGGFRIFNNTNKEKPTLVFNIDEQGNLFFSGEMHTNLGKIGGWTINERGLHAENIVGLYASNDIVYEGSPIRFWAGKENNDYKFLVTADGSLYASNAQIKGSIVATDGYIDNSFYIGAEKGIILNYNKEKQVSYIGSYHYSSGDMGYGWQIRNDGSADFNNITARGKIRSSLFEYNQISSVGGSLYIAPTVYIENYSTLIEEPSIVVLEEKENITFQVTWELPYANLTNLNGHTWNIGDYIKINGEVISPDRQNLNKIEITGADGTITNIVSTNDSATEITVQFITNKFTKEDLLQKQFIPGSMLILYGTNNNKKGLYLTAAGENSPYIDVYDDSNESESIPAVRLGNLTGVKDGTFSENNLSGYGLYSSNAYLRGKLVLPQAGITDQSNIGYNGGDTYISINQINSEENAIRIWAGGNQPDLEEKIAPFIVTQDGSLYAQKGVFKGVVKAINSEFQGSIKAAGIVIDDPNTPNVEEASKDHFFVAYKDSPETFDDYVLNIDSTGLSVWEGGLRAYSDYFWEDNSQSPPLKKVDPIYGYDILENSSPTPYFYLVDDGIEEEFNGRIVSNKGHFLQIKENGDKYSTSSVIINNGIWLAETNEFDTLSTLEKEVFKHSNKIGFSVQDKNSLYILSSQHIIFDNTGTVYINPQEGDISENNNSIKLFIHGPVKIENEGKASLQIGNIELKEVYLNNIIEGLNFYIIEEKE